MGPLSQTVPGHKLKLAVKSALARATRGISHHLVLLDRLKSFGLAPRQKVRMIY